MDLNFKNDWSNMRHRDPDDDTRVDYHAAFERKRKEDKMSKTKWTPGPWNVADLNGMVSRGSAITGWRGMIAKCDVGDYANSVEQGRANACLIAAAPDLYEALGLAFDDLNDAGFEALDELQQKVYIAASAALKKARGE